MAPSIVPPALSFWQNAAPLRGCPVGQARLTRGYRLPASHVIHTVGPVWQGGNAGEPALLASCYRACLAIAVAQRFRRLAFPAISCGVFGYPADLAVPLAVQTVRHTLLTQTVIDDVLFCCFSEDMLAAYQHALQVD